MVGRLLDTFLVFCNFGEVGGHKQASVILYVCTFKKNIPNKRTADIKPTVL